MKVEVTRSECFGVDHQASASDSRAEFGGAGDHVLKESGTEPLALVLEANSQTSEQGKRLRIAPDALAHSGRGVLYANAGHAPGVVGHDNRTAGLGYDQNPDSAGRAGLAGMTPQPLGLLC